MASSCPAGENRSAHPFEDLFVRGCQLISGDLRSSTDSPLPSLGIRFACSGSEQAPAASEQHVAKNSLAMYLWPTSQGFCQFLWTMWWPMGRCHVAFAGMAAQPCLHHGARAATMASELVAEPTSFTSTSCRHSLAATISTTPTQGTARQGQRQERCREGFSCAAGSEPCPTSGGTLAFGAANATSCQSARSNDYSGNTGFSDQHACGGETSSCRSFGQHPCRSAPARVTTEAGAVSGGIHPPAGPTHASTCVGKSAAPQGAGAATRRSFRLQCSLGGLCATASGALVQARRVPLGGNDGLRRTGGRLVGQTSQRDASTCVGGQRWPRSQRPLHCGRRHGRRRGLGGHGCDCSGGGSRNPGEEPEVPGPDPGAQRAHSGITPASASRSRGRRRGDQSQGWQPDSPQTAKQRRCQRQRRGHGWRRFTAALYTCGQGWHQEAPWIGLPSSLGVLGGPIGLRHSVMDEGDFTCSLWAAVLAANLEMEVKLGDRSLDNFMTFAEDLRITSISSVDSCGNECLQPGIYAGPDFDAEDFSYLLEPATVQFPLEDEPLCTYNCTGDVVHTIASHQSQGVACMRSRIPFHFALREGIGKLLPSISLVGSLHRLVVAPGAPGRRPSSLSCLAAAWLPAPRPSLQHCSVCGLLPAPRSPALASLTGGPCNQHLSLLPGLPTRIPRADLFPLLRPLYTFCLRTSMEILRGTFACLSTHGSLASGPLGE